MSPVSRNVGRETLNVGQSFRIVLNNVGPKFYVFRVWVFYIPVLCSYVREEERMIFLAAFIRDAKVVDITKRVRECRDPKDDKFLELAINGEAACIVSGDSDLLILNPFRGIAILTPQEFLVRSKKQVQE